MTLRSQISVGILIGISGRDPQVNRGQSYRSFRLSVYFRLSGRELMTNKNVYFKCRSPK